MKRVLIGLLILMGIMSILVVAGGLIFGAVYVAGGMPASQNSVLYLEFNSNILEYVPDDPLSQLMTEGRMTLRDLHDVLTAAAADPNISGVVARFGIPAMGFAQIQEIREAVQSFKESGKFTVAFSDTFGEVSSANGVYYLASSFDEIYLQPSGDIGLTGLLFQTMFYGGALEKFLMTPQMDQRYEYKTAKNIYTDKAFTEPFRENMISMMDSLYSQIVLGIASGRNLPEDAVRKLIDNGPYLGQECLDAKLVDALMYWDEVKEIVKLKMGGESHFIPYQDYLRKMDRPNQSGEKTALIIATGMVMRGESQFNLLSGSFTLGSETIASAIRSAVDDGVSAILLRVNSPGGSYVASDTIWREVMRAREADIPVVISMSDVAASGGYFIAAPADAIVAHPGTITGSIGVLGGKLVTKDAWEFLGFSYDEVHAGKNAKMYSTAYEYSPDEWSRFQAWLDRVYTDFTQKVSDGRGLPIDEVKEIAKGRAWTGQEALEKGLVDTLGGYTASIETVKRLINVSPEDSIDLTIYPKAQSPLDKILKRQPHIETTLISAIAQLRTQLSPIITFLDESGFLNSTGALMLDDYPRID